MGSSLGPVLANILVDFHEEGLLFSFNKPDVYFRYVDDTFCLFSKETEADLFYTSFNNIHPALKFTLDEETNSSLPFLDALVELLVFLLWCTENRPLFVYILVRTLFV